MSTCMMYIYRYLQNVQKQQQNSSYSINYGNLNLINFCGIFCTQMTCVCVVKSNIYIGPDRIIPSETISNLEIRGKMYRKNRVRSLCVSWMRRRGWGVGGISKRKEGANGGGGGASSDL